MATCEVCGNSYEKAFSVHMHCQCRIVGHGIESGGKTYGGEHCAHA